MAENVNTPAPDYLELREGESQDMSGRASPASKWAVTTFSGGINRPCIARARNEGLLKIVLGDEPLSHTLRVALPLFHRTISACPTSLL